MIPAGSLFQYHRERLVAVFERSRISCPSVEKHLFHDREHNEKFLLRCKYNIKPSDFLSTSHELEFLPFLKTLSVAVSFFHIRGEME